MRRTFSCSGESEHSTAFARISAEAGGCLHFSTLTNTVQYTCCKHLRGVFLKMFCDSVATPFVLVTRSLAPHDMLFIRLDISLSRTWLCPARTCGKLLNFFLCVRKFCIARLSLSESGRKVME